MISGEIQTLKVWQRSRTNTAHALDVLMPFFKAPSGQTFFATRPWGQGVYIVENTSQNTITFKALRISSALAMKDSVAWRRLEKKLHRWKVQREDTKPPVPWWASRPLQNGLDGLNLLKAALRQTAVSPSDSNRLLGKAIQRILDEGRGLRYPWYRTSTSQTVTLTGLFEFTAPIGMVVRLGFRSQETQSQGCTRIQVVAGSQPEVGLALHCPGTASSEGSLRRLQFPLAAGSSLRVAVEHGKHIQMTLRTDERLSTLADVFTGEPDWIAGQTASLATGLIRAEEYRLTDRRQNALFAYADLEQLAPSGSFVAAYAAWHVARLVDSESQALDRLILVAGFSNTQNHWGRTLAKQALVHGTLLGIGEKDPRWTSIIKAMPKAIQNQVRINDPSKPEEALAALLAAQPPSLMHADRSLRIRLLLHQLHGWLPLEFNQLHTKQFIDPVQAVGAMNQTRRLYKKIPEQGLKVRIQPDPAKQKRHARIPILAQAQDDQVAFVSLHIDGEDLSLPLDEPITQSAVALRSGFHHIHAKGRATVYIAAPTELANLEHSRVRTYFAIKQGKTYHAELPAGVRPGVLSVYWHVESDSTRQQSANEFEFCFSKACSRIRIARIGPVASPNGSQSRAPVPLLLQIPNGAKRGELAPHRCSRRPGLPTGLGANSATDPTRRSICASAFVNDQPGHFQTSQPIGSIPAPAGLAS